MKPSQLVAVVSVVVLLALEGEGNTKKKLGEACAQREDCVSGSNCTDSKICICESGRALSDKSGCAENVESKQTNKQCKNNDDCKLVLGAGPCITTTFDDIGFPDDICACAPNNRIATDLAFCLIACDNDDECRTSEIQAALLAMKNDTRSSSSLNGTGSRRGSSPNSTGRRGTCVVSKADSSFKYCDFRSKSNRTSRGGRGGDHGSVDIKGDETLTIWLLITIIVSALAIIATVVIVVLVARGFFSGDPAAALGRTRGIPMVRKRLKMAPLPYRPMPPPQPALIARRPSAPPMVRRVSSSSLRGRRPSNASAGRRMSAGVVRGRRPSVSRESVSSRRASSTVDSIASSSFAESSFSAPPESSFMTSDAESSVYSDYSRV